MKLMLPVRTASLTLTLALVLAPAAVAQFKFTCSKLATAGTGKPGTTLTLNLTRSASQSFAVMAVGTRTGTTSLPLGPLGTLKLDLRAPFLLLPLGKTDIWGNAKLEVAIHELTPRFEMKAQAISWGFSLLPWPTTGFCTSNVADIKVGD